MVLIGVVVLDLNRIRIESEGWMLKIEPHIVPYNVNYDRYCHQMKLSNEDMVSCQVQKNLELYRLVVQIFALP